MCRIQPLVGRHALSDNAAWLNRHWTTGGSWYYALCRIRQFEAQVQRLAGAGEIPGFPHLSTGQEAVAVGVCAHLSP